MAEYDPELGKKIHEHLALLKIETPFSTITRENIEANGGKYKNIENAQNIIMQVLGLDLKDDSLKDTPRRVAKMFCEEIFYGLDYSKFPACTAFENKMGIEEMVAVQTSLYSNCEHHFLPFIGDVWCAYIPAGKILGTSKFNRIVDFFARRPQVQERLNEQIHAALRLILETEDVAVFVKAEHFCAKIRGVKDHQAKMVTSKVTGRFRTAPELRMEFLALTKNGNGG